MHRAHPAISRFARAHLGLVTRDATRAAGLSASGWRRWLADGRLIGVHESVARLPGVPVSAEQTIAAAVLACGPGAAASVGTAGWLWDLEGFAPVPVHVTVPARGRRRPLAGVVMHRPLDIDDLRPVLRRGVPTTNPLRLLCDLGAEHDDDVVADTLERLLITKTVTVAGVYSTLERHARPGRAGIGPLRRALDQRLLDQSPPDSILEVTFARLLASHGLPPARFHAVIMGFEVDFVFDDAGLVVEVDGLSPHARMVAFETNRKRDLRLAAAGYQVVRVTWSRVVRDPAWVASHIADTIAHRRAA